MIILKAFRDKMSFVRKNGQNIVTIKVHETSSSKKQMIYTFAALILGLVCGVAMHLGLDVGRRDLGDNQLSSRKSRAPCIFERPAMMVAPVTFLAIISGITNMSDAVDIGKAGSKLVFSSVLMLVVVTVFSLDFSFIVFRDPRLAIRLTQRYDFRHRAQQFG